MRSGERELEPVLSAAPALHRHRVLVCATHLETSNSAYLAAKQWNPAKQVLTE